MSTEELPLSRRDVIRAGGALVICLSVPHRTVWAQGAEQAPSIPPSAFVQIDSNDTVTIISKHIELGQGSYTGLATVVADELDCDWAKVRVVSAPVNPALYGNSRIGGVQVTGGSTSLANSWDQLRLAGATARAMLLQAAAKRWNVDSADVRVEHGRLVHAGSGRSGSFGQFAAEASRLPPPRNVSPKTPAEYQLIGKDRSVARVDTVDKVTGRAKYTIDIQEPGMLTVLVARSPRFGGKVATFDAAAALKVEGVVAAKQITNGIAVYAKSTWPAIKGRQALSIQWDYSAAENRGTKQMLASYSKLAETSGALHNAKGDVVAALKEGVIVEAEYQFPYLAHAPMEPLDGFMTWDGETVKARYGCQAPGFDQPAIAQIFGVSHDKVTIETMLAGGSFGRRAQIGSHLAVELAEITKAIGPNRPIKLVWTREDDIRGGHYRPLMVHRLKAAIRDGNIVAWSSTVAGQSYVKGSPVEKMLMPQGIDSAMTEGASELLYDIDNFRCDAHIDPCLVPTHFWRSVGHSHTGYAVECFVDMLLQKTGKDPVTGRLAMMNSTPRAAAVLRAAAAAAHWDGPMVDQGRARGVAVVESFKTYVAEIAEVSIDANGDPKVHKIWAAVDAGTAVNPDVIRAQVEGGIGFALGHALYAEVPLENGTPTVSNFYDYRSLRINEMPDIEVVIVASQEKPTGIGEPPVPPCAPAVANALARLGHERPTRLPMVRTT
jgi:isoquinoline 1-oxidoreductase beta subunit